MPKNDIEYQERVQAAIRHWYTTGDPIKVRDIRRAIAAGEEVDEELLAPVKDMKLASAAPPRSGRGGSEKAWKEYAKAYTNLDPEMIDGLDKDDLIVQLEVAGVIPVEE